MPRGLFREPPSQKGNTDLQKNPKIPQTPAKWTFHRGAKTIPLGGRKKKIFNYSPWDLDVHTPNGDAGCVRSACFHSELREGTGRPGSPSRTHMPCDMSWDVPKKRHQMSSRDSATLHSVSTNPWNRDKPEISGRNPTPTCCSVTKDNVQCLKRAKRLNRLFSKENTNCRRPATTKAQYHWSQGKCKFRCAEDKGHVTTSRRSTGPEQ